jgi:hypothetical protein
MMPGRPGGKQFAADSSGGAPGCALALAAYSGVSEGPGPRPALRPRPAPAPEPRPAGGAPARPPALGFGEAAPRQRSHVPQQDCTPSRRRSTPATSPPRETPIRQGPARCLTCLKALRKSSSFFIRPLRMAALVDTLQAAGAEDKPLLGSKLSADSGAKTRLGFSGMLGPSNKIHSLGLASRR